MERTKAFLKRHGVLIFAWAIVLNAAALQSIDLPVIGVLIMVYFFIKIAGEFDDYRHAAMEALDPSPPDRL